ncbi:hypothetical protein GHT06_020472 [Daphnia sinensis]|uniref:Uncharacterized protein n=1 Tax=Daphnia sinensis TaxID=1820382 RepID=A0AAD5KHS0_9CRUS|nr:hypothetical protein GHT06_020472 [Daphnia sinensis]
MAVKKMNQVTIVVTIEVLEKELTRDLKKDDDAAAEDRLQKAKTALELADDRTKRPNKNYEALIPLLEAEAQEKYLIQHKDFVNRFHKMSIVWRKRRPVDKIRSMGSPTLQVAAPK